MEVPTSRAQCTTCRHGTPGTLRALYPWMCRPWCPARASSVATHLLPGLTWGTPSAALTLTCGPVPHCGRRCCHWPEQGPRSANIPGRHLQSWGLCPWWLVPASLGSTPDPLEPRLWSLKPPAGGGQVPGFRSPAAQALQAPNLTAQTGHGGRAHLLQFGKSQRVAVLGAELHEPHVGRVGELCGDAEAGEEPAGQSQAGSGGSQVTAVGGGQRGLPGARTGTWSAR